MSVSVTVNPVISPRSNTPDKRLPAALWHARGQIVGDVSGGTSTVLIQWPNLQGYLAYSIDFVSCIANAAAAANASIALQTRMFSTGGNELQLQASLALLLVSGNIMATLDARMFPVFVPEIDGQWILQVTTPNTGAGNNWTVYAAGFCWDRASLLLPGGPVRSGETIL